MTARRIASLAALALLQDVPTTRQIDLTITDGTSMAAAASPDRRSIAIDLLGGIWILPMRGAEAKRVTPALLEARQLTWSPDSRSIAFQGYQDGTWHIYVISADGGDAKAITSGAFDDREPAWSHDGSRIAFSSDRRRHHLDLGSRRPERRGAADQQAPRVSPAERAYQGVINLIAKSGVTLTPTIGIMGDLRARELGDRTLLFDPRLALYPLPTVAELTEMAAARPDPALDARIKP